MTRAERKAKEIITTIQVVCITLLVLIICYAIAKETLGSIVENSKATTVVDCSAVPGTYYYEVTVETESGERYAYYGDYKEIGDTVNATFSGECIKDAR